MGKRYFFFNRIFMPIFVLFGLFYYKNVSFVSFYTILYIAIVYSKNQQGPQPQISRFWAFRIHFSKLWRVGHLRLWALDSGMSLLSSRTKKSCWGKKVKIGHTVLYLQQFRYRIDIENRIRYVHHEIHYKTGVRHSQTLSQHTQR